MATLDRLHPPRSSAAYGHLHELARQLQQEVNRLSRASGGAKLTVVDVGCGDQQYRSLFSRGSAEYIGVDIDSAIAPDHVADAHRLSLPDNMADVVMCLQTLHYLYSPVQAIQEAHRVLKPGGTALYSTHGIAFLQLRDADYYRWTHLGLERTFGAAADWGSVRVQPNGGAAASAAFLVSSEIEAVSAAHPIVRRIGSVVITLLNVGAERLDAIYKLRNPGRQPHGAPNYLVVARRRQ